MAKRICKVNPKQTLGLLAYATYAEGVGKVKLHDNIYVMEVLNDAGLSYYNPRTREKHLANLKAWRKNLKQLYFDTWTEGMGGLGLPVHQFRNICRIYDNLYAADVTGACINNTSDFASSGLNHYFYLKFAWAPVKDRQKLYDEAIAQCYGPAAAAVVKAYFEDLEDRMEKFASGHEFVIPADSYLMLGDNSNFSMDSRYFGVVPRRNLIGRAWFVFYPFSRRIGYADRNEPVDEPTGEAGITAFPVMSKQ